MENKVRLLEVRTTDGKPILNLRLIETQAIPRDKQDGSSAQNNQANAASGQSTMTDAQKRYIFRLLAEQGMEPDEAHEHLKKQFGVDSLQDVSKTEASKMIEQLLEEAEKR